MKEVWLVCVRSFRENEVHSVCGKRENAAELMTWLRKMHPDLEYWIEGRLVYDL